MIIRFALNQVNVKSKPMFFFLDEVMGKLSEDSIEEFIDSLHITIGNIADSHELKDTAGLLSYRINDIQLADLEGKIRSIEMNNNNDKQS